MGAPSEVVAASVGFTPIPDFDVTIAAGAASGTATFTLTPTDDTIDETDETVTLTATVVPATGVTVTAATVTITDDDAASAVVSFKQELCLVFEGETVLVTVVLDNGPEESEEDSEIVVPIIHTPLEGASADDYSGVPASVTFGPGDSEATFTVSAAAGDGKDDGESVELGFGTLPEGLSTTSRPSYRSLSSTRRSWSGLLRMSAPCPRWMISTSSGRLRVGTRGVRCRSAMVTSV